MWRDRRAIADWQGALLPPLPEAIAVQVVGLLSIREKLQLSQVSGSASWTLDTAAAWDPLVFTQEESGNLLRYLDRQGPLCPLPPAVARVTHAKWDLMDPDPAPVVSIRRNTTETCSNGKAQQHSTVQTCDFELSRPHVFDPLDELLRLLRCGWFPSLVHVEVSNIEPRRMDDVFLLLRVLVFGRFPHLRLSMAEGRYELLASSSQLDPASPTMGAREAAGVSLARQPVEAALFLDPATEFSAPEIRFLQEQTAVFKAGSSFHFAHEPLRTLSDALVRKHYAPLEDGPALASLS
jgi:hypothetical protein